MKCLQFEFGFNTTECERDRDALGTSLDPSKKDADPVNIHKKPARPLVSEGEEEAESDGEQEASYKEEALSEKDEEQDGNSVGDLFSKVSCLYSKITRCITVHYYQVSCPVLSCQISFFFFITTFCKMFRYSKFSIQILKTSEV